MAGLPLGDIQGIIIRGYRSFIYARHFVLVITDAVAARKLLGSMAGGSGPGLQITSAARWTVKPSYTLNVGFTYEGLAALGLPSDTLATFPTEFQSGAVRDSETNFDVGSSAPANWVGGMGTPANVHVLFSLFTRTDDGLETYSKQLRTAFAHSFCENYSHDGKALPEGFVHFGYRDGISQPALVGGPPPSFPYPAALGVNALSPDGDFLLGYKNTFGNKYSPKLASTTLGLNGSFGAFRILMQDVAAFEAYLQKAAPTIGVTPDVLAAKFLGRWRNGTPLALSPETDQPVPEDQLNMFLYDSTATGEKNPDPAGVACPIGSHIRRSNPRDESVAGFFTQQARLLRRNQPYGPPYNPANPNDGIERGLIGYFINADFHAQFEFVTSQWLNLDNFTGGAITGTDPIMGDNQPASSDFTIATSDTASVSVSGFSRFVITRGSAYCFLPSLPGLRYLGGV